MEELKRVKLDGEEISLSTDATNAIKYDGCGVGIQGEKVVLILIKEGAVAGYIALGDKEAIQFSADLMKTGIKIVEAKLRVFQGGK